VDDFCKAFEVIPINDREKDRASDKELGEQEMTVSVELECYPK
jgi:hypothetical protein